MGGCLSISSLLRANMVFEMGNLGQVIHRVYEYLCLYVRVCKRLSLSMFKSVSLFVYR